MEQEHTEKTMTLNIKGTKITLTLSEARQLEQAITGALHSADAHDLEEIYKPHTKLTGSPLTFTPSRATAHAGMATRDTTKMSIEEIRDAMAGKKEIEYANEIKRYEAEADRYVAQAQAATSHLETPYSYNYEVPLTEVKTKPKKPSVLEDFKSWLKK